MARITLRFAGLKYSDRLFTVTGIEITDKPRWDRLPQLEGSRIAGQTISINTEYSPAGYRLLSASIWACLASSADLAVSEFVTLLTSDACERLGDVSSRPITIPEYAVGKHLVGYVSLESISTGNRYSQTTWMA